MMQSLPLEIHRLIGSLQRCDPQLVILFGSYARGDLHEGSDIDLLIIKETDRPFLDRIAEILAICPRSPRVEPIVCTPAEFDCKVKAGDDFMQTVLNEGIVLIQNGHRVVPQPYQREKIMSKPANQNQVEGKRWINQAEHDLDAAQWLVQGGFFADACFKAQQLAEKALKGFCYYQGERQVIGHSTHDLVLRCQNYRGDFRNLLTDCNLLDRHYIPSQYPNGLPGGVRHDVYDQSTADEAIVAAQTILNFVKDNLQHAQKA